MESRSLGRRKIKGQPFRTPPEWEGQLGSFKEGTLKEGNNEE